MDDAESWIRLAAFASALIALGLLERAIPRRQLRVAWQRRWRTNLSIVAVNAIMLRLLAFAAVPVAAVAAAHTAQIHGIGLLKWLSWPNWLEVIVAVLILDLAIWFQHVVSHRYPVLWRLHQVHHADRDVDVTTALRFHPIEIALSMVWKIVVVFATGASVVAVVLFEVVLNVASMFNHANVRLSDRQDSALRRIVVTPDMHRVHHSVHRDEHNTNFGFCLSIWDKVFGTYAAQPRDGHEVMDLGLSPFRDESPSRFGWSLKLPFANPAATGSADGSEQSSDHKS